MRRTVVLAALLLSSPLWAADEKAKSGLEKGSNVPAFDVLDITGPKAGGKALCYR